MKKLAFLALFLLFTLPYSVSATYGSYSQNQFNTSSTVANLSFNNSPESVYLFVTFPRNVNITNATIDIEGYEYVEDDDTEDAYVVGSGSLDTPGNVVDEDFDTWATATGITGLRENHTLQYPVLKANWTFKIGGASNYDVFCRNQSRAIPTPDIKIFTGTDGTYSVELPYDCISSSIVEMEILIPDGHQYFEGKLVLFNYPENITIDFDHDGINDYVNNTIWNETSTITLNYSVLNTHLHENCASGWNGNCDVRFNITNDANISLYFSNLNFEGNYLDSVGNCTESFYNDALLFRFFDEVSLTMANGSAEYVIEDVDSISVYNDSVSNVENFTICTLGSATYNVDMTLIYWNSTTDQRSYYLYNAAISNTSTTTINLYQISSTPSEKVEVTVKDANDDEVADAYVNVLRYYIDENLYRTVTIGKTDNTGKFILYIHPDTVYYQFIISLAGVVSNTYSAMTITDTADDPELLTLYTTPEETQYFEIRENIGSDCYVNYTSNYTICTVVDSTGLITSARLIVDHFELAGPQEMCDETGTGSAITLSCYLGDRANGTYSYRLILTPIPNSPYTLMTGSAEYPDTPIYGDYGIFPVFIMVAAISMIGIFNPAIAAILAVIGLGSGAALGLMDISGGAIISLMFVALLIFFKGKSS